MATSSGYTYCGVCEKWTWPERMVADGLMKVVNLLALVAFVVATERMPLKPKRTALLAAGTSQLSLAASARQPTLLTMEGYGGLYLRIGFLFQLGVMLGLLAMVALLCMAVRPSRRRQGVLQLEEKTEITKRVVVTDRGTQFVNDYACDRGTQTGVEEYAECGTQTDIQNLVQIGNSSSPEERAPTDMPTPNLPTADYLRRNPVASLPERVPGILVSA